MRFLLSDKVLHGHLTVNFARIIFACVRDFLLKIPQLWPFVMSILFIIVNIIYYRKNTVYRTKRQL